jgi:hypothetical protein
MLPCNGPLGFFDNTNIVCLIPQQDGRFKLEYYQTYCKEKWDELNKRYYDDHLYVGMPSSGYTIEEFAQEMEVITPWQQIRKREVVFNSLEEAFHKIKEIYDFKEVI